MISRDDEHSTYGIQYSVFIYFYLHLWYLSTFITRRLLLISEVHLIASAMILASSRDSY